MQICKKRWIKIIHRFFIINLYYCCHSALDAESRLVVVSMYPCIYASKKSYYDFFMLNVIPKATTAKAIKTKNGTVYPPETAKR